MVQKEWKKEAKKEVDVEMVEEWNEALQGYGLVHLPRACWRRPPLPS